MNVDQVNKTLIESLIKNGSPQSNQKLKLSGSKKVKKDPEILEASRNFEGLFLQHLMNEMLKSTGDEFMGKGLSGDIFKGLFVEKMSAQLIQGRGMGLSDMIYDYFEKTGYTEKPDSLEENNE